MTLKAISAGVGWVSCVYIVLEASEAQSISVMKTWFYFMLVLLIWPPFSLHVPFLGPMLLYTS